MTLGHSVKYADKGEQCFNPKSKRREVSIDIAGFTGISYSVHCCHVVVRVCLVYAVLTMCAARACASMRVCVTGMGHGQLQNIPNTEQPYHSLLGAGVFRYNEYVVFHRSFPLPSRLLVMSLTSS